MSAPANNYVAALSSRIGAAWQKRAVRTICLACYYILILAALVWLYGRGSFTTPKFIYQGF